MEIIEEKQVNVNGIVGVENILELNVTELRNENGKLETKVVNLTTYATDAGTSLANSREKVETTDQANVVENESDLLG